MGRLIPLALPRLGETMEEGRITLWLKQPGEAFKRGETILECETDKTVVEVPALTDGIMREHLAKVGDRVPVDGTIAGIEVEGEAADAPVGARASGPLVSLTPTPVIAAVKPPFISTALRASPAARRLAKRSGTTLSHLTGSGRRGRIQASDLPLPVTPLSGLKIWPAAGAQGATAFLIHGLFADAESFAVLARALARRGIAAAAVDLPGHGASGSSAMNLAAIAHELEDIIGKATRGPLILLGHSFGALLATRLAQRFAARLQRLVLIAPAGFGTQINGEFLAGMLAAGDAAALASRLEALGAGAPTAAVAELALARIGQHRKALTALIEEFQAAGHQRASLLADLSALRVPVTAVFGRHDHIIPATHAINAPRSVEVRFTETGGHVPHWFEAEFIASLV